MFTLALSPRFWAPVKIEYVNDDGKKVVGTFEVQYKRHSQSQIEDLREKLKLHEDDAVAFSFNEDFLRQNVTGFRGIEIPANDEMGPPQTITAVETGPMLDYLISVNMTQALIDAFVAQAPKARTKN